MMRTLVVGRGGWCVFRDVVEASGLGSRGLRCIAAAPRRGKGLFTTLVKPGAQPSLDVTINHADIEIEKAIH